MAISDTLKNGLNKMNVYAQRALLGTVIQEAQEDIETLELNETIIVPDDSFLTVGTTTATAETKIIATFDETTTGIGIIQQGSASVPMVLNENPGAAVIGNSINIEHSAGAGDCDDLIAGYQKVSVIGDGDADITIVGGAQRAYVGEAGGTTVADECYGSQPWAKHEGTGAIVAMSGLSAKLDVSADNFTATTVNAIHAHIEGEATVTGLFDGIIAEAYGDVTSMDSMLHLMVDGSAAVTSGIKLTGNVSANFIEIDGASTGVVVAAGSTLTHDPNSVTSDAYLVVKIGATSYAMPLYEI